MHHSIAKFSFFLVAISLVTRKFYQLLNALHLLYLERNLTKPIFLPTAASTKPYLKPQHNHITATHPAAK